MAYPVIEAANGLVPVNMLGGRPYAGGIRHMPIASGYAANIGFGDPVKRIADGTIQLAAAGDVPIGVFVGCSYTNPTNKQPTHAQMWPTGTVAADAMGFIVDDPDVLFKVAVTDTASTAVTGVALTAIGKNAKVKAVGDANTATGNSTVGIDDNTIATTAGHMLRIVDGVEETSYIDTGTKYYREVLVRFNTHQYNTATGV